MAISMAQASSIVITIGVIGIVLGAMATTLDNFASTQYELGCDTVNTSNCSSAYNVIANSSMGIGNFAVQMPVIGTIGAVAVIITLVVGGLMVFGSKR